MQLFQLLKIFFRFSPEEFHAVSAPGIVLLTVLSSVRYRIKVPFLDVIIIITGVKPEGPEVINRRADKLEKAPV